ncbi:hypothetical protein D3C77_619470 [compost metagenome]
MAQPWIFTDLAQRLHPDGGAVGYPALGDGFGMDQHNTENAKSYHPHGNQAASALADDHQPPQGRR